MINGTTLSVILNVVCSLAHTHDMPLGCSNSL
jgi:hypothetical protein